MTDQDKDHEPNLSPTESTKIFYNEHVDDYIANIDKAGVMHAPAQHLDKFVDYLDQFFPSSTSSSSEQTQTPPCYKLLELGCGYGRDAERFVKTGRVNLIATDYARSMLLKAQERLEQHPIGNYVHFLELDMRDIAKHFIPNSLHGIWACATIIHVPKKEIPALLDNIFNVLKPGGICYVSVKVIVQPPSPSKAGNGDNGDTTTISTSTTSNGETFDPDLRYGGIRKFYAFYQVDELLAYFQQAQFTILDSGLSDHRQQDAYATHPFLHVFAQKPKSS